MMTISSIETEQNLLADLYETPTSLIKRSFDAEKQASQDLEPQFPVRLTGKAEVVSDGKSTSL